MSKNQILAIVAATLLGAFWVYPSIERTQRPVQQLQTRAPASVPVQRKQTHIKPVRVVKKVAFKSVKRPLLSKRTRVNFDRADRRPTSLPLKKPKKKNNVV